MLCISVSYRKTTGQLRQKFSFSEEEQKEFLVRLIEDGIISGGVVLSTCNRSELYVTLNRCKCDDIAIGFMKTEGGRSLKRIEEIFSEYKGLSHNEIRKNCLFYQGARAVTHLYKVVCGLDSMVLGEDEILHQTKEAYRISQSIGAADGEINILFQGAFNCAKLSKSETQISETPVSIGTLTANYVEEFIKRHRQANTGVYQSLEHNKDNIEDSMDRTEENMDCVSGKGSVLIIGAGGQIGSIVAKDLISKKISVIGTTRSHSAENGLWQSGDMTWIDFGRRYDHINDVSVIVSATKSPHYTVTRDEFNESRNTGHSMLLIDLAVPYDIDRDIEAEKDVELIGIDHFKELSEKNSALKLSEAQKMERIVSDCVEDVLKRLYIRNFQTLMPEREDWFSKMIFYLKDSLDSDTLLKVLEKIYRQECR
ncbi:MAG: hypothetical protein IJ661_08135 [Lachnospiraceae bacterium]|nr:hypothetical protein [Lachnospiraceae bacterium]